MEIAANTATLFAGDMAATDIVCAYFAPTEMMSNIAERLVFRP